MGTQLPLPQRGTAPHIRPMSVVAKWLDGLRCHLVWRLASAQATLCQIGDPAPLSPKGGWPPIFGPCLLWPNGWMDQDGTWHAGGPRSNPHSARGRRSSLPQKGTELPPQFSTHVYCDQTAGWIKMPLGTEVGLSPGDVVLDEDQAPPQKVAQPPLFGPCVLWPRSPISATAELVILFQTWLRVKIKR